MNQLQQTIVNWRKLKGFSEKFSDIADKKIEELDECKQATENYKMQISLLVNDDEYADTEKLKRAEIEMTHEEADVLIMILASLASRGRTPEEVIMEKLKLNDEKYN
jgi:hypothetical protein